MAKPRVTASCIRLLNAAESTEIQGTHKKGNVREYYAAYTIILLTVVPKDSWTVTKEEEKGH